MFGSYRFDRLGQPHVAVAGRRRQQPRLERGRRNPDDCNDRVVDAHRPPDDRRVAAEPPAPERLAKDREAVAARRVLVGREEPPQQRPHAKRLEEAVGDPGREPDFRPRIAGDVERPGLHPRQMFEGRGPLAPVEEVARGDVERLQIGRARFPQRDDAIGVGIGKRPQQDLGGDAVDGDRRPEAERQDCDGGDGEAAVLGQLAPPDPHVVDPIEVGDALLAEPEGIGERAQRTPDRTLEARRHVGERRQFGQPFTAPVVAQAGGDQGRGATDERARQTMSALRRHDVTVRP